ncbi:hypothetical protein HF846_13775 [Clostridium cadaveris]|uniref:hypothetical protein n=1 Tax=Clostridium cadaveris TaxID=1529 RepID=UPI00145930C1|nr:hypothetical protein [Clostridium cadaveris]NME65664.1 hypothetical protein [Clostridium cadaveris]
MNKALLTFSNGETLELHEDQLIIPISKLVIDDEITVSQCEPYKIWFHSSAAMTPSICELLCKCDFFHLIDDTDKIYNPKAVVTIKNL